MSGMSDLFFIIVFVWLEAANDCSEVIYDGITLKTHARLVRSDQTKEG